MTTEEFLKTYMIPGTKPEANPAGFPPPNHFLVAEKRERWRPLRDRIWKMMITYKAEKSHENLAYMVPITSRFDLRK